MNSPIQTGAGSSGTATIFGPKTSLVDKVIKSATTDPVWIAIELFVLFRWLNKK